jgi:hypothetical protein
MVIFQLSALAALEEPTQFVWTASTQSIPGSAQVIEMKPTMLAPKGVPASSLRTLLTRVLGKTLGGIIPNAGIVYSVIDLEGRRQSVAYAIEQLKQNGQPVTFQTIQEWIAQNNGIDTSGPSADLDPSDGLITSTDPHLANPITYNVGALHSTNQYNLYQQSDTRAIALTYAPLNAFGALNANAPYPKTLVGGTPLTLWVFQDTTYSSTYGVTYVRYKRYYITSSYPAPSAFDPADYPQFFGPDFFPSQAIEALMARDLDSFDIEMTKVEDNLYDHIPVDVDAGEPTEDPLLWILQSKGLKYIAPIAALGQATIAKFNAPDGTVNVQTDKGDVELSKSDSQDLIDNGVPEGATIFRVDPETGTVTYKDPTTGETKTAQIPKEKASSITNDYSVYNTVNNSTKTTNIHQEINLPEVHVSGSIKESNGTLEPVSADRVEAARTRFQESWNNLKLTFSEMFSVDLVGVGRLPVWNWPMLGHVIVIDFNNYADELNWLGLAFLFFATISAVFIVINH